MTNDSNFPPKPQGQNSFQGNYQRQNQQSQSSQVQQKAPYQPRANYQYQQQGNYQEMSPQQLQAPTHQSTQEQSMTDILASLVVNQAKADQRMNQMFQRMDEISTHNKMLEMQIAQQAESSTKAQSEATERKEHCEAVTLMSGKKLEGVAPKKAVQMPPKPVGQARAEEREFNEEVPNPPTVKAKESEERREELKPYSPPVPFPQRLIKPSKLDKEYEVFTKMLKKLYVYIPFHELIKKGPLYNKFLKEILSKKRTIEEVEPPPPKP
ncbi:unnamed protein product [Rhodiola kirilowii]